MTSRKLTERQRKTLAALRATEQATGSLALRLDDKLKNRAQHRRTLEGLKRLDLVDLQFGDDDVEVASLTPRGRQIAMKELDLNDLKPNHPAVHARLTARALPRGRA